MRQIYIKGHIESVRTHVASDGTKFTQLLIPDNADGELLVAQLAKLGIIWDTHDQATDWADVPAKYKRKDGTAPGHDWMGHDVTQTPLDLQAIHAMEIE
jgi:hypothetical protein